MLDLSRVVVGALFALALLWQSFALAAAPVQPCCGGDQQQCCVLPQAESPCGACGAVVGAAPHCIALTALRRNGEPGFAPARHGSVRVSAIWRPPQPTSFFRPFYSFNFATRFV